MKKLNQLTWSPVGTYKTSPSCDWRISQQKIQTKTKIRQKLLKTNKVKDMKNTSYEVTILAELMPILFDHTKNFEIEKLN